MDAKPRAREGLLASDHSKRGRRFVTVLDPTSQRVTLLEPWEHGVLVLCDGTRTAEGIADLLRDGVSDRVSAPAVRRCLERFARAALIDDLGLRRADDAPPAGPRTLANLQQAYREWHKDPEKTGRILSGLLNPPFPDDPPPFRPSLEPTTAVGDPAPPAAPPAQPVAVGSTLVMGEAGGDRALRSVLAAGSTS